MLMACLLIAQVAFSQEKVEKWDVFELTLHGPEGGNPFVGIDLSAEFRHGDQVFNPEGFYDGNGVFKIRFMPNAEGKWTYVTHSNRDTLDDIKGEFICSAPSADNHGPVSVKDMYNFTFADSSEYIPFGTTIYQWNFQSETMIEQTLQTLKKSPFNKARFLVIPPYDDRYLKGPGKLANLPFEGTAKANWNLSRFNPIFFQKVENCILKLRNIGVQADVIIFNPYDEGWGFERMDMATRKRFVRYCVARFAAYRNVWWSLANENSFIESMTDEEWTALFKEIKRLDPYHHLISIHNAGRIYNYTKPWVSHVSMQYYNAADVPGVVPLLRDIYRKPVVLDEINYEGDINRRWGQLTGEEMTYRFWITYIGGGYATHGEAFEDNPWISTGGKLIGKSPERIAFLKKIIEDAPALDPIDQYYILNMAGKIGEYYLKYFGKKTPDQWRFLLPDKGLEDGMKFKAELIDTWNMTIKAVDGVFEIKRLNDYKFVDTQGRSIPIPNKPYMALRLTRID